MCQVGNKDRFDGTIRKKNENTVLKSVSLYEEVGDLSHFIPTFLTFIPFQFIFLLLHFVFEIHYSQLPLNYFFHSFRFN